MQALLVSTYDLGRQPLGLASPAAWLRRAGIPTDCVDTSRERLDDERIAAADLVAFYLPMHTATRLAGPLIDRVRRVKPSATLAAYGLYAPLNAEWLRARGVTHVLGPEGESEIVALATGAAGPKGPALRDEPAAGPKGPALRDEPAAGPEGPALRDEPAAGPREPQGLAPQRTFISPDRSGLPPLTRYAALQMPDGSTRTVGSTDATRGCKHLCRHCPIVPVYQGRFSAVPLDVVMADVRAQVAAGAQHISFGDPDFFNGPTHATRLVERLAAECPAITYDVTIKIEHLIKHRDLLPRLAGTGCLFITSAVESIDDHVLQQLAKGHTRTDFIRAVEWCRQAGVTLAPTFVAFTPWTSPEGYSELLDTIEELDLVEQVAPIQLAIRLLVTTGSPLMELPEIRSVTNEFDPASLTWPWRHRDSRVDALQASVMTLVGANVGASRRETFDAIRTVANGGRTDQPRSVSRKVPYMTEAWYCCAEPSLEDMRLV